MAAKKAKKAKTATAKKAAPKAKKAAKKSAPRRAAKKAATKATKKKGAAHQVIHWEIQSPDPVRLHSFYRDALGWTIDTNNAMGYGLVASGGEHGIDGGIGGSGTPTSRVVVYASVPDIIGALARIESLGGRTVMPRTDVGPVIMALYTDPEGNTMGLLEG